MLELLPDLLPLLWTGEWAALPFVAVSTPFRCAGLPESPAENWHGNLQIQEASPNAIQTA